MRANNTVLTEPQVITCRGTFNQANLIKLVDPLISPLGNNDLIIDFSRVTFVKPFPIVTLTAMLASDVTSSKNISFRCPTDSQAANYLATCGFIHYAKDYAEIDGSKRLLEIEPSSSSRTLLPLTCLDKDSDIKAIIDSVRNQLDSVMGTSGKALKMAVKGTIQELCANIFQHAHIDKGWIFAQQYFNSYKDQPYVEISIGDAGCGIKSSLCMRFSEFLPKSDEEVMINMISERLSRHEAPNRGTGYHVLQQAAKDHDGSFSLRSGTGLVRQPRKNPTLKGSGVLPWWPGTQLLVVLSCS